VFEDVLKGLNAELGNLRAKRVKCGELMEKVQDREIKARLSAQYDIISHAIERAALCISILGYEVSVEASEGFTEVKFPVSKSNAGKPDKTTRWGIPIPDGWDTNDPVFQRHPMECDCFRSGELRCGTPCVWAWPPGARVGDKAPSLRR